MKKYIGFILSVVFFTLGILAYLNSQPDHKNQRVYQEIKKYSPYYLDKRFGGLQILSKADSSFIEKPDNMVVFHRLDTLEKKWGKDHLRLNNDKLLILGDQNQTLTTIILRDNNEIQFIHQFYGI